MHETDGIAWLRQAQLGPQHAIVTSLPDRSGMPGVDFDDWRAWFADAAALVFEVLDEAAVAVFYQTDVVYEGRWIDKAYLVQRAADEAAVPCLWHRIVCRAPAGTPREGRPTYGHWLAFSRTLRPDPGPDVLPETGAMTWTRAMPMSAAVATCEYLRDRTPCTVVVDPFCGKGTILAVANNHGLDAIGVELLRKRAKTARRLVV